MYIVLRIFGEKIAQSMTYKIRSMGLVFLKKLKQEDQKNSRNIYQIIGKKMYNSDFSI